MTNVFQTQHIFHCTDGTDVSLFSVCDGNQDCPSGDDESYCVNFTVTPVALCKQVQDKGFLFRNVVCPPFIYFKQVFDLRACQQDIPNLYENDRNISHDKQCVYELINDTCDFLTSHENGRYLSNCSEYSCDKKHFKCPGFYCIPLRYVCNRKIDCPGGLDELHCPRLSCPSYFKCMNSGICISIESLCDGLADCPQRDDEQFCSPALPACPSQCIKNISSVLGFTAFH